MSKIAPTIMPSSETGVASGDLAFRAVFENAPYGMLLVDRQGVIAHCNGRLGVMFGYSPEELVGRAMEILLPHRFRDGHVALRRGYAADPGPRPMGQGRDLTGRRKDGVEFPLEIGLCAVDTQQGMMSCASIVDVTERKRADLQLREAYAQLEEFTYVASHDLRSPIRGIANLIEFLKEDFGADAPEPARRNLNRMAERIARMEALIEDLLTYARAGRRTLKNEIIDLRALVDETVVLLEVGEDVALHVSVPDEIFEGARTPLATVIRNLVANAIKHHDLEHKRIEIIAVHEGNSCIIDVIDDGPGIPEVAQQRVFRLFQTLNANDQRGSGMGLAVAQRLAEGHGGSISLFSKGGERGCRFRIDWPRYVRSDHHG